MTRSGGVESGSSPRTRQTPQTRPTGSKDWRARLRRVPLEAWLALGVGVLLLAAVGWPDAARPVLYPDTLEYLRWPGPAAPRMGVGARMFGYPLLLRTCGHGGGIVAFQLVAWLTGFAGLGFALARVPGMLALGVMGLAPAIGWWSPAVLTESLSLSLLAALVAIGLRLARGDAGLPWMLTWALVAMLFGFLRPSNLVVVPFLLAPFLSAGVKALGAASAFAVLLILVGFFQMQSGDTWRINYLTAFPMRIASDPEARRHFRERGMPSMSDSAAFSEWFDAHAERAYPRWVVTRPASYVEAWDRLVVEEDESPVLRQRYFARQESLATPLTPFAEQLFERSALPRWLWLGLLLGAPIVALRRQGRVTLLSGWAVMLAVGTYTQTFLAYHGSGTAEHRHLLVASLLYRVTWMIALLALVEALRAKPEQAGSGQSVAP